jgi:hypothetical protein
MTPNRTVPKTLARLALPVAALSLLAACGTMGDTGSVKKAGDLAVACQTEAALAAADQAMQGGGLGAGLAELERVVILRDAGSVAEANAALAAWNARTGADAQDAAETERAVSESLEELRAEREKQTGSRHCP